MNVAVDSKTDVLQPEDWPPPIECVSLGAQHVLAMFGATVLAPVLMGFDPNTAILASGIATIIFYFVVRGKVPSYLGSSFAFITAVTAASGYSGSGLNPNLGVALGGIFVAGLIYGIIALFVIWRGPALIEGMFPPLVSGTVVAVIGLSLAGVAVSQVGKEPFAIVVAGLTLLIAAGWSVHMQGRLRGEGGERRFLTILEMMPIVIAGVFGYILYYVGAKFFGLAKPIDFSTVQQASWIGTPRTQVPTFSLQAIITIAPVVIVLLAENLGHVKAIGGLLQKEKKLDGEIGRTFLGDAIGTMVSSSFGGPGVTTYAENMAVMRLSRNFSSITFVVAGLIAILLGFSPKFGAMISSIPLPVLGGLSFAMFGLITAAAVTIWQPGIRDHSIDFTETKTLLVVGIGLVLGAGNLTVTVLGAEINGIVFATIATIAIYHFLHWGRARPQ